MRIPLSAPDITEPEIEAVAAVLRTSRLSLGPQLEAFEAAFTMLTNTAYAIGVSSGTAGLHLAMLALGLGADDEVIVPSFTFIAAANCIRYVGAMPVFVDIDRGSLNLAIDAVERAITPRSRAIIAVHTFGRPAAIEQLRDLARRHKLFLVEDACEAVGALHHGKPVGSFGDIAVFAFYPNKQITTGEGGMVVTRDAAFADRMRSLRNQGRSGLPDIWADHTEVGFNYRLSEVACTLGLSQLARLPEILARRETIARSYAELLAGSEHLRLPELDVPRSHVSWFAYVVRLAAPFTEANRNTVVRDLQQAGIGAGRYFAPIHLQPAYRDFDGAQLPVTEAEACRTIALPFFNRLTTAQMEEVAATLLDAVGKLPHPLERSAHDEDDEVLTL